MNTDSPRLSISVLIHQMCIDPRPYFDAASWVTSCMYNDLRDGYEGLASCIPHRKKNQYMIEIREREIQVREDDIGTFVHEMIHVVLMMHGHPKVPGYHPEPMVEYGMKKILARHRLYVEELFDILMPAR